MVHVLTDIAPKSLDVTVIIAAKNEAPNIGRCLAALSPAKSVCVVDSRSRDETAAIAVAAGAEVVQFNFSGGYPKKRQWALDTLPIATGWVLLLDADEVVPAALWQEIAEVTRRSSSAAYLITKGFHFLGRRLRYGGFSHMAILLFRKGRGRFERLLDNDPSGLDMEVHERLIIDGPISQLSIPLIHEDYKGLEAYLERHNKYSTWEAEVRFRLLTSGVYGAESIKPRLFGNSQERRRALKHIAVRMPFEPQLWFVYHYFLKLGLLEGRRGLIASQIRSSYVSQARAKVFERRLAPLLGEARGATDIAQQTRM